MASDRNLTASDLRSLILLGVFVYLAIRFINAIAAILLIFALVLILVVLLNPIVSRLEKHKVPRALSASAIGLLSLGAFVLIGYLVVPIAISEIGDLALRTPEYASRVQDWFRNLSARYPQIERLGDFDPGNVQEWVRRLGPLFGRIGTYTVSLASAVATVIVIFIATIYSLANPRPLVEGFLGAVPEEHHGRVIATVKRITEQIKGWALASVIGMIGVFLLTWIGLSILDVQPAFLFAVIAGLMEIVPIVGPIIAAVPPVVVALLTDPVLALWTVLVFIVIQQIESNVIIPLVMSSTLSLHPVSIIFSVLVMGGLFGLIGVFLAAPAAAVVKVIYEEFYLKPKGVSGQELSASVEEIVAPE